MWPVFRRGGLPLETARTLSRQKIIWGGLYCSQSRYDDAEPLFVSCLEKRSIAKGDSHPDTLSSFNNSLAWLYYNQGRCDDAEPLFVNCLEKSVLGESHPHAVNTQEWLVCIREELLSD